MSSKSKNKLNIISRLAKFGEFPIECTGCVPVVEIKGMCEAYVSGCSKITEYNDNNVIFHSNSQTVQIIGESLVLSDFTAGCVCISGCILEVRFSEDRK